MPRWSAQVGAALLTALAAALRVPKALPGSPFLRGRVTSVLHRMVDVLGDDVLQQLPPAIEMQLEARRRLHFPPSHSLSACTPFSSASAGLLARRYDL